MTKAIPYAVCYQDVWYVCQLVPETEFGGKDQEKYWCNDPVWMEINSSAYVCKHQEAETAIPLRMPQ